MTEIQLEWNNGGNDVKITGTFNNWQLDNMIKVDNKWIYKLNMQVDVYIYKYKVDGEWCVDEKAEKMTDENGKVNNFLIIYEKQNIVLEEPYKINFDEKRKEICDKISKISTQYCHKNSGKIDILPNLILFNIVDCLSYIFGPFKTTYNWRNESNRPTELCYNIITVIFIDIYGNYYTGTINDRNNPFTNIIDYYDEENCKPYGFKFQEIFNKLNVKSEIQLSINDIYNKKIEKFNEIKSKISKHIFDKTKEMLKLYLCLNYEYKYIDGRKVYIYREEAEQIKHKLLFSKDENKLFFTILNDRKIINDYDSYTLTDDYINSPNYWRNKDAEHNQLDNYIIENIKIFSKKYIGEIKYELFEKDHIIDIINYINNCIKINKTDKEKKELLIKKENERLEKERLLKIEKEKELKAKNEEMLKQQKLNNAISSLF
jgi:hypothetical protein